ncbi:MAG TPA: Ni/Fe-hydrogenase, b-type cytochrome subunit, partial [Desulfuromonadales bacterium]|nr:Ni/Fe-hydrogenase, b-type cytochrome subunit [Desulfuromonadales bacterium]
MLEVRYIWEWPVRITHWVNALCIVVLSITGYYIGHPFISAPQTADFVMGWVRFVHFVFAFVFTISIVSRLIWASIGNQHCTWKVFFPWLYRDGRSNMWKMFKFYTFTSKKIPREIWGHNSLAAAAYSGVMILFLLQIFTGFALYGQYEPGGFWDQLLGPLLPVLGNQWLRLTHHMIMWLLIGFFIHHVYSAWLMDVKERNGTMGSIFGGYKF